MIRAAIYARFSSDLQSDKSIDDQISLCRDVCARAGMAVVSTFEDRAVSGASAVNRYGFNAMMRAAEAKAFDVIVAEDMDRIFRDQADYHSARRDLDFLGVTIHTAAGKVGKIDGAMRALMSEMFLENLAVHVRRGLDGVVRDGRHAGGRAYGYQAVPGKAGELAIVEAEATIVRHIFADYAAGVTPRDIAAKLNKESVKPPRGDRWNGSTINGNLQRGAGILLNEIYVGRIVWNKVRMVKDPATGKRISRPNPPDQYRTAEVSTLRIVADDVWQIVQGRKRGNAERGPSKTANPKTKRMLAGLLRCGACGGAMVSSGDRHGTARIQCSAFRESGTCQNGRRVKRDDVERMTLAGPRAELAQPVYLAEYVAVYNEERKRLARDAGNQRGKLERRKAAIGRELRAAIDAIIKAGIDPTTLAGDIKRLEAERGEIDARLAAIEEGDNVITLHPAALDRYRADLDRLAALLPRPDLAIGSELEDSVHALISAIIIHAPANSEMLEIEIRGRLDELLQAPTFSRRSAGGELVVARDRYRQTPPGKTREFCIKMTG